MTDNAFPGPMSMVKIDGTKIRQLREQQGLTQLYLATAVEVTTDTISRWENRRYPSIKRENGLKLAEALNVELDALLEEELEEEIPPEGSPAAPVVVINGIKTSSGFRKSWPLLILSLTLFCVLMAFIWYSLHSPVAVPLSAVRVVPPHTIAGQPFPVLIKITGTPDASTALIVKESVPENSTIHRTSPNVTSSGLKHEKIKWLKKINQTAVFTYLISVSGKKGDKVHFEGTAANSSDSDSPINGDIQTTIGFHHWADTDNDNIISDNEILTVYDHYSEIVAIDLDIDQIEEIWLGSGYKWDSDTGSFIILE